MCCPFLRNKNRLRSCLLYTSEGYFRFKADYSISSKEFYDIYKQWCEDLSLIHI